MPLYTYIAAILFKLLLKYTSKLKMFKCLYKIEICLPHKFVIRE